jgi:hypothetical protein
VANIAWYDFRNDGHDPFYNEENFGLIRADFRPKPTYRTLATLGRMLAGRRFRERIDLGPGAYALRFGHDHQDVVAVWSATSNSLLSVETSGTVSVVNSMGQPIAPDRTSNGTVLTLQAGFPVYVQGDKGFTFKPVGWIEPLKLTDSHLHPGEQTIIHVEPDAKVHDWIVPPGWNAPQPRTDGTYELTVPRTAAPGSVDLKARVLLKGQSIVPLTLTVEPQVLRL